SLISSAGPLPCKAPAPCEKGGETKYAGSPAFPRSGNRPAVYRRVARPKNTESPVYGASAAPGLPAEPAGGHIGAVGSQVQETIVSTSRSRSTEDSCAARAAT